MLLVHFKISRGEKYIKYPTNENIFTKIVLQPPSASPSHPKQNKQILSWTHWLCLMIFSSKVDLGCGHKDSLYPLSRRGKEDISRLFQDVCYSRTQWFFDLNVSKLLTVIVTLLPAVSAGSSWLLTQTFKLGQNMSRGGVKFCTI